MEKKKLSLAPYGLKSAFKIAFCLVFVAPLLLYFYLLARYVFPVVGLQVDLVLCIAAGVSVTILGCLIIRHIFGNINSVSAQVNSIAASHISQRIDVKNKDDLGNLREVLDQLTQHIHRNMEEKKT